MKTVNERLEAAAALFKERNASYGGNYLHFGEVMQAIFPDGLGDGNLTQAEWRRLMLISHMVTKITRYAQNFRKGGHADSLEDLAVYATMAAETDEMSKPKNERLVPRPAEDPPEAGKSDEWYNTRFLANKSAGT